MRRVRLLSAALLLLSVSARAQGGAPDGGLASVEKAYADVDYPRCRDEAQKALQQPARLSARVDAYRYLGLCDAAVGDVDKARDAFKHMLAIDKDARLPDGLSPRFTSSYREAKGSFVMGQPLSITVAGETLDGGVRVVRLKLVDELQLVQKIGWRGKGGASAAPVRAAPLIELELPAAVDVTVVAYDAAGGEVGLAPLPAKKAKAPPPPPPPKEVAGGDGGGFPWLAVGGITGGILVLAAAGAGAYLYFAPPQAVTLKTDVAFGD